jgi:hypothetical protein
MSNSEPTIIYLDQLHWIHLAQVRTGHASGLQYKEAYDFLYAQKKAGKIVCPLSLTHYMELQATSSYRQRTDVASVMAELSAYMTISSTSVLRIAEIDHALKKHFGKPTEPATVKPFGLGASFAGSGQNKLMTLTGSKEVMDDFARAVGGIDKVKELEARYAVMAEFELLRGPHEIQLQDLRQYYNYAPEAAEAIAHKRAAQEEELARQLKANPSQMNNLDGVVTARYLYWELFEPLYNALKSIDMTIQDFLALGRGGVTQFIHDIPTADVLIAFIKANLKNLHRTWKKNDIHDMDALAIAIPYCDVVVTEKHAYTQLLKAGVEQKYHTKLLRRLEDLPAVL